MNGQDLAEFAEIGAFASMNNGATPDGELVVGLYTDMDTMTGRAYLLSGGTFIPFDVPGSTFTAAWDVNPSGDVVGVYRDAAGFHGFLWAKLRFRAVDYPGATTNAGVWYQLARSHRGGLHRRQWSNPRIRR